MSPISSTRTGKSLADHFSNAVFGEGVSHYLLLLILFVGAIVGEQSLFMKELPFIWFAPLMIVTGAPGSFRPLVFGGILCNLGALLTMDAQTQEDIVSLLASVTMASLFLGAIGFILSHQIRKVADTRAEMVIAEHMQRELNHRIKNLFSVVIALVKKRGRAARAAPDSDPRAPFDDLVQCITALARAHAIDESNTSSGCFELGHLIGVILSPYCGLPRAETANQIRLHGPAIWLPTRMLTPVALLLHELATNAVKYGALSSGEGQLDISWDWTTPEGGQDHVMLKWRETIELQVASLDLENNQGYGLRIIEASTTQLDGTAARHCGGDGLKFELSFPVERTTQG